MKAKSTLLKRTTINGIRSEVHVVRTGRRRQCPMFRHVVVRVDHAGCHQEELHRQDYADQLTALDQHAARMERAEESFLDERDYLGVA